MTDSTFDNARANGAGVKLTDGRNVYVVSDWSTGTRDVYGWPLVDGERGSYGKLPNGLRIFDENASAETPADHIDLKLEEAIAVLASKASDLSLLKGDLESEDARRHDSVERAADLVEEATLILSRLRRDRSSDADTTTAWRTVIDGARMKLSKVSLGDAEGDFWDVYFDDLQLGYADVEDGAVRSISVALDQGTGKVSLNAGYVAGSPEGDGERSLFAEFEAPIVVALMDDHRTSRDGYETFRSVSSDMAEALAARIEILESALADFELDRDEAAGDED